MSITKDSPPGTLPRGESLKLRLILAIGIGIFFLRLAPAAFAAMTLSTSNLPTTLHEEQEFTLNVSLIDAPKNKNYYLRASFFFPDTTNYFGYTLNHLGKWHNDSSQKTLFLQINTGESGQFAGTLTAKPDLSSSFFQGTGDYQFKIRQYTESGSLSKESSPVTIAITAIPTPTLPLPPTNTPRPNPTPTTTSISPSTPTPSSIPTSILPSVTDNSSPKVLAETDENLQPEVNLDIIDLTATAESEINQSPTSQPEKSGRSNLPVAIISAIGVILMLGGGIPLIIQEIRHRKK